MRFDPAAYNAHQIHAASLVARRDVVGVGLGHRTVGNEQTDRECLKVFVTKKLPQNLLTSEVLLPRHVPASDGTPVGIDVEEIGQFFGPPLRSADEAIVANHA